MANHLLKVSERFETLIVSVLLVLLMAMLLGATGTLTYLFALNVADRLRESTNTTILQQNLHVAFGGFLVLLLGLGSVVFSIISVFHERAVPELRGVINRRRSHNSLIRQNLPFGWPW